jgi:DNA-binding response OmpR family regulator
VLCLCDANDPPNILITDIDLGATLSGFDVAAVARRRWPMVGIILISGLPANHTGQALDPRDRYLQKPFYVSELLVMIDALVHETKGKIDGCSVPIGIDGRRNKPVST